MGNKNLKKVYFFIDNKLKISFTVFTDTGKAQGHPRRSLKTDAKKAASSGER